MEAHAMKPPSAAKMLRVERELRAALGHAHTTNARIEAGEDVPDFIIGSPWSVCERIPGTERRVCSRCPAFVGIAPRTQKLIARYPGTPILCFACMMKDREITR
jgi:hypothetical protein